MMSIDFKVIFKKLNLHKNILFPVIILTEIENCFARKVTHLFKKKSYCLAASQEKMPDSTINLKKKNLLGGV